MITSACFPGNGGLPSAPAVSREAVGAVSGVSRVTVDYLMIAYGLRPFPGKWWITSGL